MVLSWLPLAADFRGDFRVAQSATSFADRASHLAALAQHQLSFLETIQVDRALGQIPPEAPPGFAVVRLAILASSTVNHLAPAIRVAGLRRHLLIDVYVNAYGQYRQELLDPASALHRFNPQIVLFSLGAREAIAGVPVAATAAEVEAQLGPWERELRNMWGRVRDSLHASVIQQTVLNVAEPLFGSYDRMVAGAPGRLIGSLNDRLAEAAAADKVLLLDIARASERDGLDAWFDVRRWLQGKLEIAPQASARYGELVARLLAAQRGQSKKCLVLDLDNTLWGGVVGDDGLDGIVLGEGSATGEAHLAFQRYARQLRDRGVILAVCSKNDPATAEAVFRDHPEMLLKRSDIAAFVANWDDKAANLKLIATQLNIGTDSLVFVDDNPAERARIRQSLPMVAVPELPRDAAQYVHHLADAGYFEAVSYTADDQQRGDQYAANASREASAQSAQSMDDFLRGLEMSVVSGPVQAVDLARVTQLINKTNQFNPTTRRHSADEVARLATAERHLTLQFRLIDRFGDNGLVSAMILRPISDEPGALEIDTWIMSCRVFGRQLECEAMNVAVEAARRLGFEALRADYIPTARNGVVKELYSTLGFQADAPPPLTDGATRWRLQVWDYVPHPTHIRRSPVIG